MRYNLKNFAGILSIMCFLCGNAQNTVDTHTRIFDKSFKSLRVSVVGNDYAPPVIKLGGVDKIKIEFDQLSPEMQYMRYSVVHCDVGWRPSQLVESEYVGGFNEANVENYDFSSATFAHYVHYNITVPNEDMDFLISGNYLLKVYPEDDPENVYLQVRFSLSEDCVDIVPEVTSRTDIDYNAHNQQLSVAVDTRDYYVTDMYNDLIVTVSQNSRTDNEAAVNRPLRVAGRKAYFEHDRKLIFPAGNEFRRFEMTTTNYAGMGIDGYSYHDPYYHVALKLDEPRAFGDYLYFSGTFDGGACRGYFRLFHIFIGLQRIQYRSLAVCWAEYAHRRRSASVCRRAVCQSGRRDGHCNGHLFRRV